MTLSLINRHVKLKLNQFKDLDSPFLETTQHNTLTVTCGCKSNVPRKQIKKSESVAPDQQANMRISKT